MLEEVSNVEFDEFLNSEPEVLEDDNSKSKRKEEKGNYFGLILYPNEDIKHSTMLKYLLMKPEYEVVYINHKGEGLNDSGEEKKDHTHVMVRTIDRMTVGKFVKWFDGWINHAECIHSPKSYIRYMLHDNPASINAGKIPYSINDLQGTERLWKHVIQNSHFVQLGEILFYHPAGGTFYDTYLALPDNRKPDLGSFMWSYLNHVDKAIQGENKKYFDHLAYLPKNNFSVELKKQEGD